ncbi:hypothetical protein ACN28C_32830 [Plantactinospora sp. WMMC1484]|uniref:hypothetical protein n=1 Tax=Plantactinospora sp. WMMC1484 TaxID=3404122 RepID=UPI003BF4B814
MSGILAIGAVLLAPSPPSWAHVARVEDSTHLSVSTTNAKGRVGDTVSIRVTVKNHGPTIEPEWALTGVETQPGTRFVSGGGCRPDPNGGQYCPSPGPLAVGASQTVVLRYKIIHAVQHPERQSAGFGFYEALVRKGGTDDVDLSFQIYIAGAATKTPRTPARSSATPARSSKASARSRQEASTVPPSPPSAVSASAPTVIAAATTGPATHVTAPALDKAQHSGVTTGWAVGTSGVIVIVIGVGTLVTMTLRRRRRAEPGQPSTTGED